MSTFSELLAKVSEGPFYLGGKNNLVIYDKTGRHVADCLNFHDRENLPRQQANAELIALLLNSAQSGGDTLPVTISATEYSALVASNTEARRIAGERDEAEGLLKSVMTNVPLIIPEWRRTYLYERCEKFVNRHLVAGEIK